MTPSGGRPCTHLEHGEQGLGEVVEGAPLGDRLVEVELSPEQLHAQQGEDDDEEEEQQQQGRDGADRVQQRRHQVGQRVPVSEGQGAMRIRIHTGRTMSVMKAS